MEPTAIFRVSRTEEPVNVERSSKSVFGQLCKKILFSTRGLGIRSIFSNAERLTSQQLELLTANRLS
jgi:hypothetical protein